jgi:trans-aconitate methyltransferase
MNDLPTLQADPWDPTLYDEKHSYVTKAGEEVIRLLAPRAGERILDLGCGTGHLTAKIAESGATVVGIDPSPRMLERARHLYPALRFELAAAEDFADPEPFDAVFSNAAIHWSKQQERLITGVYRSLKPGGRFVAEFGGRGSLDALQTAIERIHLDHTGRPFASPWYFPGIGEYAGLLDRCGFETGYARLSDRPATFEGAERLRDWLQQYLPGLLNELGERKERFLVGVEDQLRPAWFRNGVWTLDVRRLQIMARRCAVSA